MVAQPTIKLSHRSAKRVGLDQFGIMLVRTLNRYTGELNSKQSSSGATLSNVATTCLRQQKKF